MTQNQLTRRAYNEAHREEQRAYSKAWRLANRDKLSANQRIYRLRHMAVIRERKRIYELTHRVIVREKQRRWAARHPSAYAAKTAARRAMQMLATPSWANKAAIATFYAEAVRLSRETGIAHTVDHIYPLCGRNVCGLHVEYNLQILTKSENGRKSNKHPGQIAA